MMALRAEICCEKIMYHKKYIDLCNIEVILYTICFAWRLIRTRHNVDIERTLL
jgi:hypothetical protein